MTPYEIGILLHYACCADDYQDRGEPIFRPTMHTFVENGLLTYDPAGSPPQYRRTDKLIAYCDALGAVPLPVQVWQTPPAPETT